MICVRAQIGYNGNLSHFNMHCCTATSTQALPTILLPGLDTLALLAATSERRGSKKAFNIRYGACRKQERNVMNLTIPTRIKIISGIMLLLIASTAVATSSPEQRQTCQGVLALDETGYLLRPDPGSKSLWCDAYIGFEKDAALARRVLQACTLGSRCHIEGSFQGHGVFYWTRISSVYQIKSQ
jgi:hypothetical protein